MEDHLRLTPIVIGYYRYKILDKDFRTCSDNGEKPEGVFFMEDTIIKATVRSNNTKIAKKSGFIPGVLNGPGTASTSVIFEIIPLNKIIAKHGKNAKLWVDLDNEKHFGYIKEIQRHPVEGKIIHIAFQMLAKDQEVKMDLPIIYHGIAELEHRLLQIQVYKSEIKVSGIGANMPDSVVVDVSEKESGESITAIDFHLPKELIILDSEDELYAGIKTIREAQVEESEEVKPA